MLVGEIAGLPELKRRPRRNTYLEKLAAFEQAYDRLFPKLYAYVAFRVGRAQDAEDIVSESFLKAAENLNKFDPRFEGALDAWLFSIARNLLKNYYRRMNMDERVLSPDELPTIGTDAAGPDERLARKERFLRIRRVLQTLGPRYQEVITLKFYGGLRNRDIAETLEIEERTVAAYLVRGLRELQARYTRLMTESDKEKR